LLLALFPNGLLADFRPLSTGFGLAVVFLVVVFYVLGLAPNLAGLASFSSWAKELPALFFVVPLFELVFS
jgi:hypothetical protein